MTQRRGQRSSARLDWRQLAQIDLRILFRVVAEHHFAGANTIGGNAGIGLQAHAQIWSGASGAGAADDFVSGAQGDSGAGRSGQGLGALTAMTWIAGSKSISPE